MFHWFSSLAVRSVTCVLALLSVIIFYKLEWNFIQSYPAVSSDVFSILYSVDLWSLSHSVFQWAVKFFPPCVAAGYVVLPNLFQLICEVLSILCCSILWWSSTLCFSELWSFFSSPVPLRCEVLLFHCSELWSSFVCFSSQLWSFSHSVFQWAVEPGFSCQYFNMQGKKQPVCLSVMVLVHCVHWFWRQEKTERSVMNGMRFCPSMCMEGLRKYPVMWTVWYTVCEARVGDINCLYYVCYHWMFPSGLTSCIFLFILS